MRKRIISILLAVCMLLTMDGTSLYAAGSSEGRQQEQTEQETGGENIPGQDPLNPEVPSGDSESPGEDPEDPEIPGGEQPDPQPPGGEQEQEEYTIYFNLAGGTTPEGETSASLQVKKGEIPDAAAVAVPQKKGYLFQGWLDDEGKYYNFDQPITENIALLAAWVPIIYRVQFDLNGGIGDEIPEQTFTYDEEQILPAEAGKKSGYVFIGWRTFQIMLLVPQ